jgi:hypothetical protein
MARSADGIPLQIRAVFRQFYPRSCLAAGGLNFFAQKSVSIRALREFADGRRHDLTRSVSERD